MKNLVGKRFAIADDRYLIVDVQQFGRDALIFAEADYADKDGRVPSQHGPARTQARTPARTAFHYRDIAALLEAGSHAERVAAAIGP